MSKKSKKAPGTKQAGEKKPRIRVVSGEPEVANSADAPDQLGTEPKAREKKARADGTLSGLDAAAKVLTDAGQPLNAKEILERIQSAGLWKTDGKTPHATLYSAIIREIGKKGDQSRFSKAERGRFTAK